MTRITRPHLMAFVNVPSVVLAVAAATTPARMLDAVALLNAEYRLPIQGSSSVQVRDGKWAVENAQGRQSLTVLDLNLHDDLDGDGLPDAVVQLVYWGGGSGVFNYLAAVINDQGQPLHVASAELGDRVQVKSVTVKNGRITVRLVVQGADDPACCPMVPATRVFSLVKNHLVEVSGA